MGLIPGHKVEGIILAVPSVCGNKCADKENRRKRPRLTCAAKTNPQRIFITLSPGVRLNLNFATFPGSKISLFRSNPFSPPSVEHQTRDS